MPLVAQEGADRVGPAGLPQHDVVAGIVALGDRPDTSGCRASWCSRWRRSARRSAGGTGSGPSRRTVTGASRLELAAVGLVEGGQRHPEFADALLREEGVAVPAGRPAALDVADRDPDVAAERLAERADLAFEDPAGGRFLRGRRRSGGRGADSRGRRPGRRTARARCCAGCAWASAAVARPMAAMPASAAPRANRLDSLDDLARAIRVTGPS